MCMFMSGAGGGGVNNRPERASLSSMVTSKYGVEEKKNENLVIRFSRIHPRVSVSNGFAYLGPTPTDTTRQRAPPTSALPSRDIP